MFTITEALRAHKANQPQYFRRSKTLGPVIAISLTKTPKLTRAQSVEYL